MMALELGEIVTLKSGGPTMTVIGHAPDKRIIVVWVAHSFVQVGAFSEESLRLLHS